MKNFLFIASISILIITTAAAILSAQKKNTGKIKPIYILIGGVFISVYLILLHIDYKPDLYGSSTTPFLALFHTIQIMLTGYDYEFLQVTGSSSAALNSSEYLYMSLLFVLAPAYTFGFVLSFFENITAYIKMLIKFRSDIYIISDLNEKSLTLAKSVKNKFPKALVVFMNISSLPEESAYELIGKAKKMKTVLLKKEIGGLSLKLHNKDAKAVFFAIHESESENLENALNIIEKFRNRENTNLYVYSISKEGGLLLDSIDDGIMRVRRINEVRSLVHNIIHTKPITKDITESNGKKIISTLIVGAGRYGTEFLKALLWCGQLPGYELELNVIDSDPLAESKFRNECPEIMALNRNKELGEAKYDLKFYNGIDIHTYQFSKTVSALKNTSVVYIALGNDELNIETAINLRILFERAGLYPVIRAIVYSDIKYNTLKTRNLINYRGESYDIEVIGNTESRFTYDAVVNEQLEALALECHLRWSSTQEERQAAIKQFNEYEYFRNSSIATAIHERYRKEEKLEQEIGAVAEHMRWNAYMRTEGYVFSGSPDKATRNDRAKMHHNLHRYGLLNEEDIQKDIRIISANNAQ